jgi:hypothetical protein
VSDPVAQRIVPRLDRPSGNITGFANYEPSLAGKWLELLSEIAPGLTQAAIMFNPDAAPVSIFMPYIETAARSLKVEQIIVPVHSNVEIETAIIGLGREPGSGLVVMPDAFLGVHRASIILAAAHARYVQVRIRVGVRFRDQNNPVFYRQQLNDELNRYLSPWAYDEGADIVIGQRIYAGSIIDFIEQRPYVDYVAGIKLFSSDDGQTFTLAPSGGPDGDGVESVWPDAVLVAARQHQIDLIQDEIFAPDEFKGINYMKIELDFVVG